MSESAPVVNGTRVRRRRRTLGVVAVVLACWLAGDLAYSRLVDYRLRRWETNVLRDADGVRVGCDTYTTGNGETALLMIHGFADSPAVFHKMARSLAGRGFTCRVIRLPGFAEPMAAYALTNRERWLAAVTREAEMLRTGHESVWLVGHSMGAALAVQYMLDNPRGADGVVALAPLLGVSGERSPVLPARAWYRLGRVFLQHTTVVENCLPHEEESPQLLAHDTYDRFVPCRVYDEMFSLMDSIGAKAGELDRPLLMVLARGDRVTDSRAAETFFQQVHARRKEIMYVGESGHVIPMDRGWERTVARIVTFVRGDPPPAV